MNIVLIGFRGVGKTRVGRVLAEKLGMRFVDADENIQETHHVTIREIFETKGESHFRLIECDAINELCKLDGIVLAVGGGAVLRYKNIRNMKRNGRVVLLEADADTILGRLTTDPKSESQRPSLTGKDIAIEIKEQMQIRRQYYVSAADYVVSTANRNVEAVADEIIELLQS
jgi:shikimate kinase